MADDASCGVCPSLMAQIAALQNHISELRARLAGVGGGAHALALFVDAEITEPTMPWKKLLPAVVVRAENLAEQARGRY